MLFSVHKSVGLFCFLSVVLAASETINDDLAKSFCQLLCEKEKLVWKKGFSFDSEQLVLSCSCKSGSVKKTLTVNISDLITNVGGQENNQEEEEVFNCNSNQSGRIQMGHAAKCYECGVYCLPKYKLVLVTSMTCSKLRPKMPDQVPEEAVRIFVEFKTLPSAIKALTDLNGRFFGGRAVKAPPPYMQQ